MANPQSPQHLPDPARSYERAKPQDESGMGRLDNNDSTPTDRPDQEHGAVTNRQDPTRQLNAEEVDDDRRSRAAGPSADQPEHSMYDDEPLGEDLTPTDIQDPRRQRNPRHEGKGGTP